jgi:hypothetical protein
LDRIRSIFVGVLLLLLPRLALASVSFAFASFLSLRFCIAKINWTRTKKQIVPPPLFLLLV